jgi:hypothetical protein
MMGDPFWSWNFWEGPTKQVVGGILLFAVLAGIKKLSTFKEKFMAVAKSRKFWSYVFATYHYCTIFLSGIVMRAPEASIWLRFLAWVNICVYTMLQLLSLAFQVQLTTSDLVARNIEITESLLKRQQQPEQAPSTSPVLRMPKENISPQRTAIVFMLQMIPVIVACFWAFSR